MGVTILKNMEKLLQHTPNDYKNIVPKPLLSKEDQNKTNSNVYDDNYGFEAYAFDDKIP
jgi:hypothetical protein